MLNNDLMECDKPSSSHELDEVLISESNLEGYRDFRGELLFSFD